MNLQPFKNVLNIAEGTNRFRGNAAMLMSFLVAIVATCGGCSSNANVSRWQTEMQSYVALQADNDMDVLRQSPEGAEGSLRRFGVIDGSSEAQGVLLGFRQVAGRWWYIYLVGITKSRDVEDIHMMAVSRRIAGNSAGFDWMGGQPDGAATSRYRAARLTAWRKGNPADASDDTFEITFPASEDVFTLQLTGDIATAVDVRSGTTWTLVFSADAMSSAPGNVTTPASDNSSSSGSTAAVR